MNNQIPRLKHIESLHEQREFNRQFIPFENTWVEIGNFKSVIEKFEIKERWKCIKRTQTKNRIIVNLKKIDYNQQQTNSKKIITKILSKHGNLLTASLLKCIVKGFCDDKKDIERHKQKIKYYGNKEAYERWERNNEIKIIQQDITRTEKLVKELKNESKKLKKERRQNGKKDSK